MTFPDSDSIDDYGGILADLGPVEDPTTDRPAAGSNAALETVAQMSRVAWRCVARVTLSTSPVIAYSDAGWGNNNPPTPLHVSTGVYSLTWPATVTDAMNVSHNVQLHAAIAVLESSGAFPGFAFPLIYSANVVRIFTFDTSFATNDLSGQNLLVFAR